MMPPLWLIKIGLLAFVFAMTAGLGYDMGRKHVQARWDKAAAEQQAQAEAERETNRLAAQSAAAAYEAQRATIARRAAAPSPESQYALHATICPPAGALGKPLELGDVPVPGPVLDRLRSAGADEAHR